MILRFELNIDLQFFPFGKEQLIKVSIQALELFEPGTRLLGVFELKTLDLPSYSLS